jgi:deoxycytidine triphosphate deaminase
MILGVDKVLELIRTQNLIEGLDEEDVNFEGCGVDLRIGEIYEMKDGEGFLHIETRDSPKYKLIGKFEGKKNTKVKIEPRKVYLGKTIEKINTPENLFGWFIPRATFYRCGIVVQGIRTDPGYKGNFVFMMSNISQKPFIIELGARVANMVFHRVDGKPNLYKGQWQGGRTFIKKEEKQVKQNAKVD